MWLLMTSMEIPSKPEPRTPIIIMREVNTRTLGILPLDRSAGESWDDYYQGVGEWFLTSLQYMSDKCADDAVKPEIKVIGLNLNEKQMNGLYKAMIRQKLKNYA